MNHMSWQSSHCILILGVQLVLFHIFVPSVYSSILGTSSFWGFKPNFFFGGGGGGEGGGAKKPSAEGK